MANEAPAQSALAAEFERCWPWLEASINRSGFTHTKASVWNAICAGQTAFWPAPDCAVLWEILVYPTGLKRFLVWSAGPNLEALRKLMPALEPTAIGNGCHQVMIQGRWGWQRELEGYRLNSVALVKDLIGGQ